MLPPASDVSGASPAFLPKSTFDQTLGRASMVGITISVSSVAKPSPKMIAVESCTHHTAVIEPCVTTRLKKSRLSWVAMGIRPAMVVVVVSMTGRIRWAEVLSAASTGARPSSRNLLNVSMSTMALFTTMPASATMPVPVMMMEKVCSLSAMPSSTPNTDITTVERVRTAW